MSVGKKIAGGLSWLGSRFVDRSAILLYHRVDEKEGDAFRLCVTPGHFEQQMEVLAEKGTVLPLLEFVERQRGDRLESGSVSVTFDDGYADVFENALPVLEKYEIPATVFVVAGEWGEPFWWDRLVDLIHRPRRLPERIKIVVDPGEEPALVETAGLTRARVMNRVYPLFRQLEPLRRRAQLAALAAAVGCSENPSGPRLVTTDELRDAARHPLITIGAHTATHSQLASLSFAEQCEEIGSSLRRLGDIVGQPVTTFSYPFGLKGRDYTEETLEAARAEGLDHALAADLNVVTGRADAMALPRLWIHDRNRTGFQRTLNGWL